MTRHSPPTDAALPLDPDLDSSRRSLEDVRLHAVAAGDEDAPLVVLLHGFPEFWYAWRYQIGPLAAAGYRVLVPDQRGYNLSDRPQSVDAYRLRYLVRDVVDLIASTGRAAAHVVGHDWGGIVGWELARRYPDVVDRLVAINAPHLAAFRDQLRSDPAQWCRSWYAALFQLPRIPEAGASAATFRALEHALCAPVDRETVTEADLERYRDAWGRDGALTGMINWYRAVARYPPRTEPERVRVPTLVCWGEDDRALATDLANRSVDRCANGRLERFSATSHWVPQERPERTTALIGDHLDG